LLKSGWLVRRRRWCGVTGVRAAASLAFLCLVHICLLSAGFVSCDWFHRADVGGGRMPRWCARQRLAALRSGRVVTGAGTRGAGVRAGRCSVRWRRHRRECLRRYLCCACRVLPPFRAADIPARMLRQRLLLLRVLFSFGRLFKYASLLPYTRWLIISALPALYNIMVLCAPPFSRLPPFCKFYAATCRTAVCVLPCLCYLSCGSLLCLPSAGILSMPFLLFSRDHLPCRVCSRCCSLSRVMVSCMFKTYRVCSVGGVHQALTVVGANTAVWHA